MLIKTLRFPNVERIIFTARDSYYLLSNFYRDIFFINDKLFDVDLLAVIAAFLKILMMFC